MGNNQCTLHDQVRVGVDVAIGALRDVAGGDIKSAEEAAAKIAAASVLLSLPGKLGVHLHPRAAPLSQTEPPGEYDRLLTQIEQSADPETIVGCDLAAAIMGGIKQLQAAGGEGPVHLVMDDLGMEVVAGTSGELDVFLPQLCANRMTRPREPAAYSEAVTDAIIYAVEAFRSHLGDMLIHLPGSRLNEHIMSGTLEQIRDEAIAELAKTAGPKPMFPEATVEAEMTVKSELEATPGANAFIKAAVKVADGFGDEKGRCFARHDLCGKYRAVVGDAVGVLTHAVIDGDLRQVPDDVLYQALRSIVSERINRSLDHRMWSQVIVDKHVVSVFPADKPHSDFWSLVAENARGSCELLKMAAENFMKVENVPGAACVKGSSNKDIFIGTRKEVLDMIIRGAQV